MIRRDDHEDKSSRHSLHNEKSERQDLNEEKSSLRYTLHNNMSSGTHLLGDGSVRQVSLSFQERGPPHGAPVKKSQTCHTPSQIDASSSLRVNKRNRRRHTRKRTTVVSHHIDASRRRCLSEANPPCVMRHQQRHHVPAELTTLTDKSVDQQQNHSEHQSTIRRLSVTQRASIIRLVCDCDLYSDRNGCQRRMLFCDCSSSRRKTRDLDILKESNFMKNGSPELTIYDKFMKHLKSFGKDVLVLSNGVFLSARLFYEEVQVTDWLAGVRTVMIKTQFCLYVSSARRRSTKGHSLDR
eukprot:GHVH01008195.1.p1 GENE.GHVH01008195.1~~GHVH01008195.1.p1  ORF type:complete len:296 (+),score=18.19 GHVH01008195.1:571-1458(+)